MTTIATLRIARANAVNAARTLATMPGMAGEWTLAVNAIKAIDAQIDRLETAQRAAHNVGKVRGALIAGNTAN